VRLDVPFVLASQSPRRRHLLALIGAEFDVIVSDVDESVDSEDDPARIAEDLARAKAVSVAEMRPDALVLGADTIVVLDGRILGKPVDDSDARRMLEMLSGRTHVVYTGIALVAKDLGRERSAVEATEVTFAPLTETEIDAYISTGSPHDKAGGYGIQDDRGALYVSRIDGDYYNVVGLPLHRLYRLLKEDFSDVITIGDLRSNLSSRRNPA
jgi:septum formation protein